MASPAHPAANHGGDHPDPLATGLADLSIDPQLSPFEFHSADLDCMTEAAGESTIECMRVMFPRITLHADTHDCDSMSLLRLFHAAVQLHQPGASLPVPLIVQVLDHVQAIRAQLNTRASTPVAVVDRIEHLLGCFAEYQRLNHHHPLCSICRERPTEANRYHSSGPGTERRWLCRQCHTASTREMLVTFKSDHDLQLWDHKHAHH
jgi:hypothetical protein